MLPSTYNYNISNQDAAISYDVNEGDDDPFPKYDVSGNFY